MRCLALEDALSGKEYAFEHCEETGEYSFAMEADNQKDSYFVRYQKNDKAAFLIWDICVNTICDPAIHPNIYPWCNKHNRKAQYIYYLDEKHILHAQMRSVLSGNRATDAEICKNELSEFELIVTRVLMELDWEWYRPEPFSLNPITPLDAEMIRKNRLAAIKTSEWLSPEKPDAFLRIQVAINDLNKIVAKQQPFPRELAAKIQELEQLMTKEL